MPELVLLLLFEFSLLLELLFPVVLLEFVLVPVELLVPEELLAVVLELELVPVELLVPEELEVLVSADTVLPGPCTAVVTRVPSEVTFKDPATSDNCSRSRSLAVRIISA